MLHIGRRSLYQASKGYDATCNAYTIISYPSNAVYDEAAATTGSCGWSVVSVMKDGSKITGG